MTSRTAVAGLLLATGLLCGCARNAVIDLDIRVPRQPTVVDGRVHAFIEVGTGLNDFGEQLLGLEGSVDVDVSMLATPTSITSLSIVAGDPATELRVRVRYCRAERCSSPDDMRGLDVDEPGFRWTFERAFYAGERTSAAIDVPALAPSIETGTPEMVCRCAVIGCAVVGPGTSSCRMTTDVCDAVARHFCE